MDERWLKRLLYAIISLIIGAGSTAAPVSIQPQGEVVTEYTYGDMLILPDIYCKSLVEFVNSRVVNASKLEVSGYNPQETGKQTVTIEYLYTKYQYDVTVRPLALASPDPVIDSAGILSLMPSEQDIAYIDSYSMTLDGRSVDASDILYHNWEESNAHATVDLAAVMQSLGLDEDAEYLLSIRAIGKSGDAVEDSQAAEKTVQFLSIENVLVQNPVLNWVDEVSRDQIRLNWDDCTFFEEDESYVLEISFFNGETPLGTQRRDAGKPDAGSTVFFTSGAISINRMTDASGNTALADRLTIRILPIGSADRVFCYSPLGDKAAATYQIAVSGGELLLTDGGG